jgi:hypothetical protein
LLLGLLACGGDPAEEPTEPEPDASVARPDAKVPDKPKPKPDAGADVGPAPEVMLESLAGKYLLRFDTFGTTTAPSLRIKSRASQLWVVELSVDGDKLKSTERLCTQVSKQTCEMGCTGAETVIDPKVITDFMQERTFERTYTLDEDGTFTGERSTVLLGYDDPADGPIPTKDNKDDPRIWDIEPGSPREGLLTSVTIQGNTLLGNVTCTVFGAQKFVSTFRGVLQGTADKPVFPSMTLELGGSGGKTLGTTGGLACNGASSAESPVTSAFAHLVRYDEGPALDCGDLAAFDELLPAEDP